MNDDVQGVQWVPEGGCGVVSRVGCAVSALSRSLFCPHCSCCSCYSCSSLRRSRAQRKKRTPHRVTVNLRMPLGYYGCARISDFCLADTTQGEHIGNNHTDHGDIYCLRPHLVQYTTTEGIVAPQWTQSFTPASAGGLGR